MTKKEKTFEEMQKLGFQFYKAEEAEESKFIQIPKQFYICQFYRKFLTPTTRELYAWLKDRMSLSEYTTSKGERTYVDENGYIYLIFTREDVGEVLGLSKQTVSDNFKILNTLGLIYEKRLGQGKTNRIYIGKVKYLEKKEALSLIETIENTEVFQKSKKYTSKKSQKSKNQTSENSTSKGIEILPQEVENLDGNYTDTTNTDSSDTDYLVVESNECLIKVFEENICELKKTTKEKFLNYCNQYSYEYIKTIIDVCAEYNTKSFAGFKVAIDSYIKNGITTQDKVVESVKEFRAKSSRNRSENSISKASNSIFNNFKQREYNFKDLEKQLLGWDKYENENL